MKSRVKKCLHLKILWDHEKMKKITIKIKPKKIRSKIPILPSMTHKDKKKHRRKYACRKNKGKAQNSLGFFN